MYRLKRLKLLKIGYLIVKAYLISLLEISLIQNGVHGSWGLADGMLNGRSCILPVMEETGTFRGLESYIEYAKISGKNTYEFWVIDQGDSSRYASLKSWLNGAALERH